MRCWLPSYLIVATATVGCGGGASDAATSADSDTGAEASDATSEGGPLPDLMPQEQCGPTGGGPHWLRELEPLTVAISCSTGREAMSATSMALRS